MVVKGLLAVALLASFSSVPRDNSGLHGPYPATVSACFVPAQHCDIRIATAIAAATQQIRVQAYGFTSPIVLRALATAHANGKDVQVILDKVDDPNDHQSYHPSHQTGAAFTFANHIPTWIDDQVAIAHNKIIVIDQHLVIGGSYNYTSSAENRNAENVTFIDSPEYAAVVLANWQSRQAVSRNYVGP